MKKILLIALVLAACGRETPPPQEQSGQTPYEKIKKHLVVWEDNWRVGPTTEGTVDVTGYIINATDTPICNLRLCALDGTDTVSFEFDREDSVMAGDREFVTIFVPAKYGDSQFFVGFDWVTP